MKRLALLLAAGSLWLFLAAVPALADGGPHVASANSGLSTLTADGCAGCHRAHTAQGQYLLKAADAEDLCLDCHGAAGTGASVNVEDGVQYTLASRSGAGTTLGALRNGGFVHAQISATDPIRVTYLRTATDPSFRAKVPVGASEDISSSHIKLAGATNVTLTNTAWGNGAAGASATNGAASSLECTSCHNPHGNGQYRILNTLPSTAGNGFVDPVVLTIGTASATTNRISTTTAHGFIVGDIVTIAGVTGATVSSGSLSTETQWVVKSIPTGESFTVAPATTKTSVDVVGTAITISVSGTGGTVKRYAALVDDAPLPGSAASGVAATVERNYTINQVRGFQGEPTSYILYTTNLASAASQSGYDILVDVVGLTNTGEVFTTSLAHGLVVGDVVTLAGFATGGINGSCTVAAVAASTTFTCTGLTLAADETATATTTGAKLGTVTKRIGGTFSATPGDYFHRSVPWNPQVTNATNLTPGANCNSVVVSGTNNTSACLTAQDAPNGRPATVTGAITVNTVNVYPAAYGQVAFNDQISAWCSTCHTRYYVSTNPGTVAQGTSSAQSAKTISAVVDTTDTFTSAAHGYSDGDQVRFSGTVPTGITVGNTYYVIGKTTNDFKVSATYDGAAVDLTSTTSGSTVLRVASASASGWFYSRTGDATYKYQHQTTTNRSCVTCHVSHGSNAQTPGEFSSTVAYPDQAITAGTISSTLYNSRLLKIDNRGTCQMCHDPTGTMLAGAGTVYPVGATVTVP